MLFKSHCLFPFLFGLQTKGVQNIALVGWVGDTWLTTRDPCDHVFCIVDVVLLCLSLVEIPAGISNKALNVNVLKQTLVLKPQMSLI